MVCWQVYWLDGFHVSPTTRRTAPELRHDCGTQQARGRRAAAPPTAHVCALRRHDPVPTKVMAGDGQLKQLALKSELRIDAFALWDHMLGFCSSCSRTTLLPCQETLVTLGFGPELSTGSISRFWRPQNLNLELKLRLGTICLPFIRGYVRLTGGFHRLVPQCNV